jgi:anti-sigma factor ChrR (cupin superfamily)
MTERAEFEDLAALDALGVLEQDEALRFVQLTADAVPGTREDASALREAAAALALSLAPVDPPAPIRERLMRQIRAAALENPPDGSKRTIRAGQGRWREQPVAGLSIQELSLDAQNRRATVLFRLLPGAVLPSHAHHGPEECYVVSGSVRLGDIALRAGDFHHAESGSSHGNVTTDEGCTLLLVLDYDDYYCHAA